MTNQRPQWTTPRGGNPCPGTGSEASARCRRCDRHAGCDEHPEGVGESSCRRDVLGPGASVFPLRPSAAHDQHRTPPSHTCTATRFLWARCQVKTVVTSELDDGYRRVDCE